MRGGWARGGARLWRELSELGFIGWEEALGGNGGLHDFELSEQRDKIVAP